MTRIITRSAFGLVAAVALFAAPSAAKAQYVAASPSVGIAVGSPGFGLNLAFGQPVYRPAPVVVAPAYPLYAPAYPVYGPRPVAPYYGAYYGGYRPYGVGYGAGYWNNGHYHHHR